MTMEEASRRFTEVMDLLRGSTDANMFNSWFRHMELVRVQERTLILLVKEKFILGLLKNRWMSTIEQAVHMGFGPEYTVNLVDEDGLKKATPSAEISFNPKYTFDSFVVGPSNRFAYNAALAVTDKPAMAYDPLFIYGPSGLGKTHLLYAIYHTIHRDHPDYSIIFIKGDEFTNELNEAIRTKTTDAFRQKYRDKDLLLVDDIQFIAGKEQTQEEFFNTFNNLYEAGHQIVLTSDRPPSEMARLENRLQTRFEWGLLVDIQPPDYETRCAIIKNKAIMLGLELPNDVIEYIAQNITANVRQIEGTVKRLLAYRDLMGQNVNDENVGRAIRELIHARDEYIPSPEIIVEETAKYYSMDSKAILGASRMKDIVLARQVSIYLIRSITNLSLPEIGKVFNQHHTTVMHSLEKIEGEIKKNRELSEIIRDIKSNINSRGY